MNCKETQKLLSKFLTDDCSSEESMRLSDHLKFCVLCSKEVQSYQKSWDVLKEVKDLEPDPAYLARFWTEISLRIPWYQRVLQNMKQFFSESQVNLAGIGLCFCFIFILFVGIFYFQERFDNSCANLPVEEMELLEDMELVQHFDVIQDIDLLEDMDIFEDLDVSKVNAKAI